MELNKDKQIVITDTENKSNNFEDKSNKQIEEMANEINEMDEPNAHYYDETLQDHEAFADCFTIAKHLYEKGYRKATEVAREIFEEIEEYILLEWNEEAYAELKKKYTEGGE